MPKSSVNITYSHIFIVLLLISFQEINQQK
uniref:Uncharacterized protein n=1 Tax=Rhizophora mucronata TaxID=61149 RepID=A0A2P2ITC9_RHIMU